MIATSTSADLPDCVDLFTRTLNAPPCGESWQEDDAARRLADLAATPGSVGVRARDADGRLDGFALGQLERSEGTDHFFLREMCVRGDIQRSGLGSRLLDSLGERLPGVDRWYLMTARDSGPAAFYESNGFRPAGRMGVYVRP